MKKYIIEYDPEADAAYVKVSRKVAIRDTIEIAEGVFADLDARKRFVGIEILDFSKRNIKLNELIIKKLGNFKG